MVIITTRPYSRPKISRLHVGRDNNVVGSDYELVGQGQQSDERTDTLSFKVAKYSATHKPKWENNRFSVIVSNEQIL